MYKLMWNDNFPFSFDTTGSLDWERIIIHYSWSKDHPQFVDWDNLKKYHVETLGWSDIGYHAGIELVDGKPIICFGRPLNKQGAHCKGLNRKAIGICLAGNYDEKPPLKMQYFILACLCREYMRKFPKITVDKIEPHSKYHATKTCPGSQFDMDLLKAMIKGRKIA